MNRLTRLAAHTENKQHFSQTFQSPGNECIFRLDSVDAENPKFRIALKQHFNTVNMPSKQAALLAQSLIAQGNSSGTKEGLHRSLSQEEYDWQSGCIPWTSSTAFVQPAGRVLRAIRNTIWTNSTALNRKTTT